MISSQYEGFIPYEILKLLKGVNDCITFFLNRCPALFLLREELTHQCNGNHFPVNNLVYCATYTVVTGVSKYYYFSFTIINEE